MARHQRLIVSCGQWQATKIEILQGAFPDDEQSFAVELVGGRRQQHLTQLGSGLDIIGIGPENAGFAFLNRLKFDDSVARCYQFVDASRSLLDLCGRRQRIAAELFIRDYP